MAQHILTSEIPAGTSLLLRPTSKKKHQLLFLLNEELETVAGICANKTLIQLKSFFFRMSF